MIASARRPNVQHKFRELPRPTRAVSSIRDNVTKICSGTFDNIFTRKFRSEYEAAPSSNMCGAIIYRVPFRIEDACSGMSEASQATSIEALISETKNVSTAHVVCVDSCKVLHSSKGAHERMHCIDTGGRFCPEKRLLKTSNLLNNCL